MTNADKIRQMTDEELAKFIDGLNNNCHVCSSCKVTQEPNKTTYHCKECKLRWLQQEVTNAN